MYVPIVRFGCDAWRMRVCWGAVDASFAARFPFNSYDRLLVSVVFLVTSNVRPTQTLRLLEVVAGVINGCSWGSYH